MSMQTPESVVAKVKVAAIQAASKMGDIDANIASFTELVTTAANEGAKIIVLPEACITGYSSQDFKTSWCVPNRSDDFLRKSRFKPLNPEKYALFHNIETNKILQHFTKLSKNLQIYLTVPYIEKFKNPKKDPTKQNPDDSKGSLDSDDTSESDQTNEKNEIESKQTETDSKTDEKAKDSTKKKKEKNRKNKKKKVNSYFAWNEYLYYNSVSLINPKGEIVGHYRKTNLWPSYDNAWATPGSNIVTVDTEYGKIGLGICFDIHKILRMFFLLIFLVFFLFYSIVDLSNIFCLV